MIKIPLPPSFERMQDSVLMTEQYICEECGKVVTEKYGSGRFCSRGCANRRHHSDECKLKISKSVSAYIHTHGQVDIKKINMAKYNRSPNVCKICGGAIPYDKRKKKTCGSSDCLRKIRSLSSTGNHGGGYRDRSAKNYKYGTYSNIYCDSSWELAFLVYCIDNNINISRNTLLRFPYIYNNEEHFYLPDFILDDYLVEIKGRKTDEVDIKSKSVPESYKLKIIGRQEIKPYIKYAISKYGKNFCEVLYDRNYPCYLDKIK